MKNATFSDAAEAWLIARTTLDQAALVADDTDGNAIHACIGANHFLREVRLKLHHRARVHHGVEHVMHVIRHAMVAGQHVVQRIRRA